MPHGGLCRAKGYPAPAQERAEGCSKCMHVKRPAPVVSLLDLGGFQVAVEDLEQVARDVEQRGIGGQTRRDRLAPSKSFFLESSALVGKPVLQVFRQVGPDDDPIALPVLLVLGVELDMGGRAV